MDQSIYHVTLPYSQIMSYLRNIDDCKKHKDPIPDLFAEEYDEPYDVEDIKKANDMWDNMNHRRDIIYPPPPPRDSYRTLRHLSISATSISTTSISATSTSATSTSATSISITSISITSTSATPPLI